MYPEEYLENVLAQLTAAEARIGELESALREAMGWNWLDKDSPPPQTVVDQCSNALGKGDDHG